MSLYVSEYILCYIIVSILWQAHLILEEINKQARMNDCRCFNNIDIVETRDAFIYTFNINIIFFRKYSINLYFL